MDKYLQCFKNLIYDLTFGNVQIPKKINYSDLPTITVLENKSHVHVNFMASPFAPTKQTISFEGKIENPTLIDTFIKKNCLSCYIINNAYWENLLLVCKSYNDIHRDLILNFLGLYLSKYARCGGVDPKKKLLPAILNKNFNPFLNYIELLDYPRIGNLGYYIGIITQCSYTTTSINGQIKAIVDHTKILIDNNMKLLLLDLNLKPDIFSEVDVVSQFIAFNIFASEICKDLLTG